MILNWTHKITLKISKYMEYYQIFTWIQILQNIIIMDMIKLQSKIILFINKINK